MAKVLSISDKYREPIWCAVIASTVLTFFSVLVLDGGQTARLSAIGLSIFWGWVFFEMWKRPQAPTRLDLFLVKWGCLPLAIGFQVAIYSVWSWRGLW